MKFRKKSATLSKKNMIMNNKHLNNENYLKTKRKSYNTNINTNFHNNKLPEERSQCICLSVTLTDSVFRTDETYYPQVFLEECKYVVKVKKMSKFITDDIEISSDKFNEED